MANDLRYAIRSLRGNRTFAGIAILTLALGIGANTAIFSVVRTVLLRPLPYPDPGALVAVHESLPPRPDAPDRTRFAVAPPTLEDWKPNTSFTHLSAYATGDFILTGAGEPERVPGANVSWEFFGAMAVAPAAGRFFLPEDDRPNARPVAVLGHDLWRARFGSDPGIVGRTIELSSGKYEVVGVAPASFAFPGRSQVWVPLALPPSEFADDQRLSFYLDVVGRLKPGTPRERAQADLTALTARAGARFPDRYEGRGVTVLSLHESVVGDVRRPLLLLLGTVVCVLLVACANVANLQLARATAREAEIAVRIALGATRRQVVRQLMVESLVLAAAGALFGILLALWARDAIVALIPAGVPRAGEVDLDPWVLAFTGLLALGAGVVFGLAPALFAAGRSPTTSLRAAGRAGSTGGRRGLRQAMVVVELALSLALVVGAGLLTRTLWNLLAVDPGFTPGGVMTMELVLPRARYPQPEQRAAFFESVLARLASHPTIAAAGGTTALPLSGSNMTFGFYTEGMAPGRDTPHVANFRGVTADYFRAAGIPLQRGRFFNAGDRTGSAPVMLINEAMAAQYWRDANPLGQRIAITRGRTVIWREIVGVVGNVRHASLGAAPDPEMYMPYAHDPFPFMRIAVKSAERPDALAGAMRAAVWSVDRDQPVSRLRPMDEVIAASLAETRFQATLVGVFAALALALASVGLYGVMAYSVSQRVHEFGVRMALGADRSHILRIVLRQGLALATLGLALGLALSFLLTPLIPVELYGTAPGDPATLAAVAATLTLIALLASYVPARRAVSVDPLVVLGG